MTPATPQLPLPDAEAIPVTSLMFTRAYQAALATGVDLLELLDAAWEA